MHKQTSKQTIKHTSNKQLKDKPTKKEKKIKKKETNKQNNEKKRKKYANNQKAKKIITKNVNVHTVQKV